MRLIVFSRSPGFISRNILPRKTFWPPSLPSPKNWQNQMQYLLWGIELSFGWVMSMYEVNPGITGQWIPLLKCYLVTCNCIIYSAMTPVFTLWNIPTHAHFEKKIKTFIIIIHTHLFLVYILLWKSNLIVRILFYTLFPLKYTYERLLRNHLGFCFWIGYQGG